MLKLNDNNKSNNTIDCHMALMVVVVAAAADAAVIAEQLKWVIELHSVIKIIIKRTASLCVINMHVNIVARDTLIMLFKLVWLLLLLSDPTLLLFVCIQQHNTHSIGMIVIFDAALKVVNCLRMLVIEQIFNCKWTMRGTVWKFQ